MFAEILKLLVIGLSSGIAAFYFLSKYFFSSYASEKGKNLATKQDIAEITKIIEQVKHQYNLIIEQFKNRNQLRLAALDKRMEVHQKAFSLLRKLRLYMMTGEDINSFGKQCEDWWWENNLYLDSESREAFFIAIRRIRSDFLNLDLERQERIEICFDKALNSIQKGIELPPINIELEDSKKEDKK